ncbi:DUF1273 domain-containing protein [Niallia sp. 03133]|uniref:DUF1273 domain-containing protein n=1 Tax=Niallia sp. 03133 TaxID=3458060 RepID=UPI0040445C22
MRIAVISGYKPFELGIFKRQDEAVEYIKEAIQKNIEIMVEEGLEWILISGQLGTELWAAEVVYELQLEKYPDLKVGIITPFLEQEQGWKESNKEWYEEILMQADYIDSVSKKPYEGPEQLKDKNVFLLQKSDALLLFYDEEKEGSPKYLYNLAKLYKEKTEYDIRVIQFADIQSIVEEKQYNDEFY